MSVRQWRLQSDVDAAVEFLSDRVPFVSDVNYSDQSLTFRCHGKDDEICVITICLNDDYPEGSLVQSSKDAASVSNCQLAVIVNTLLSDWFVLNGMQQNFLPSQSSLSDTDGVHYDNQDSYGYAPLSEESDDSDYYNDHDDLIGDRSICTLLEKDMQYFKETFGVHSLSYRDFGSIDDIDVELKIDMDFLEEEIAKAWKVNRDEPVVVRLHLSISSYLDGREPNVEIFQLSGKEKFGLGSQLKKITEAFIHERWKTLSNVSVTEAVERIEDHSQPKHVCPCSDATIARLVEMGFSVEMAKEALTLEHGDIDSALNLLLTNPECCIPGVPVPMKVDDGEKTEESAVDGISPHLPSGKDAKSLPSLKSGFLVQVMRYLLQRIPTLNEFCVICDEPHVFQNGAMLKPSVCSRELCVFGYQQLGVMADATEEIATGAEVVGLLVAIASAAVRSSRKGIIFDPFPTVVHPKNSKEFAFHPQRRDYERVEAALNAIPSMKEILQNPSFSELKKKVDKQDEFSYPLLQWIVSSNRSHIVKLPDTKALKLMRTPHQFLLLSSPPAKESAFRMAKKAHGSTFAFHGSNIENWHSIMRNGLLNASGTKYQTHGAAYGSGIYLSPNSSVSFGYSQIQSNSQQPKASSGAESRFLESKNLRCIALCEVITNDKLRKNGNIWVMPNQDHVCTRFFFVYEQSTVHCANISAESKQLQQEIQHALDVR